jgi:hypothetical protein
MIKRRGKSQIGNLTPDHKSLESRGQMRSNWGVLYIVGKTFLKAIRRCPCMIKKKFDLSGQMFETRTRESWGKMTFGCSPH